MTSPRVLSYVEALREALAEEMERDSTVFLMGEDIGVYGGAFGVTRGLLSRFGRKRVRETPISENAIVGAAIGAGLAGMRPVVEIMFMDFITLAMDPIVNQAAKLHYVHGPQARCRCVIRTVAGAGRGYGPTHSQSLEAWLVHVPGLKVVCPATPADAKSLLKAAIRDDGPVIFIEHKGLYNMRGPVALRVRPEPLGKARLARRGTDLTLVAWSRMVSEAEAAAERLAGQGVKAEVLDLRTLAPLDEAALIRSAQKTGRVLIVDETCGMAGVSAEVASRIAERAHRDLKAPIRRLTAPATPIPASPALERVYLPQRDRILQAALECMNSS